MNVVRNEKVILIKEMGNMKMVGQVYEVANITDTAVVLRDVNSKIAIGAVNIDDFDKYFKSWEESDSVEWTKWQRMIDQQGNSVAYYRAKGNKVQVRTVDGFRSEANCHDVDEFNLVFGVQLAYERCVAKHLKKSEAEHEEALKRIHSDMAENQNRMKKMVNSLNKKE